MPILDQLEIISPNGDVSFKALDPTTGVVNIGRHPDNDIVLSGDGVAEFHAVLDYRQRPYRLLLLDGSGVTTLDSQNLAVGSAVEFAAWKTLEISGFIIMAVDGAAPAAAVPGASAVTDSGSSPPGVAGQSIGGAAVGAGPSSLVPVTSRDSAIAPPGAQLLAPAAYGNQLDELIITTLSDEEWVIDVEQTATWELTIANGGDIVAGFSVSVVGIPESWVTIVPAHVNLNEGGRSTVSISITPPRRTDSRAGLHPFAVVVASDNYPGHVSQRAASVEIDPYYEFAVGELEPRRQTVGGRQPQGKTSFSIANKGNSDAPFRLEAADDERACNFEFSLPGEAASLAKQAELRLPPAETHAIPVQITPVSHPLVALRSKSRPFTITATLLAGPQTPRSLLGEIRIRPLIGPWLLALLGALLALLVIVLFRPRVYDFRAEPNVINAGESVTLSWRVSRLAGVSITSDADEAVPPIDRTVKQLVVQPAEDQTYVMSAANLLSQFLPPLGRLVDTHKEAQVIVDPVYPVIRVFSSDKETILNGEKITLRWEVLNADEVILSVNGNEEKLLSTEHSSERQVSPLQNPTDYTLRATNRYGFDSNSLQVAVFNPTATPLPLPTIKRFAVAPLAVTQGTTVTLEWEVDGATKVSISNLNQDYPPNGNTIHVPDATTDYVLTAFYEVEGKSVSVVSFPMHVTVNPAPTPTPEPQKPEIAYFRSDPIQVVKGSSTQVELLWLVNGETTNVEITGPALGTTFSNLNSNGRLVVTAADATFFILTAYNGDLNASETVQISAVEPTPIPPPRPIVDYFVLDESPATVTRTGSDSDNNLIRYEVAGGTTVNFVWSTQNASSVSLAADGVSLGEYPPEGTTPRPVLTAGQYQLTAENDAGETVSAYIQISLKPVIPPPPPYNVSGVQLGANQPITLTWEFNPASYTGEMSGFRIYRADVPYVDYTDFVQVADETEVGGSRLYEWTDPSLGCDWAYFIRGVYRDEYGVNQTTGPSEIWHSFTCE